MDRKDDDDMDAVLNKHPNDAGKPKGKAATHKSLITRNLRLAYGEVASEAVPKRFLDILDKLEDGEDKS